MFNSNSSSSHELFINICIYNYCTVVSINSVHKDKVNKIRCVSDISGLRPFDSSSPQALSLRRVFLPVEIVFVNLVEVRKCLSHS